MIYARKFMLFALLTLGFLIFSCKQPLSPKNNKVPEQFSDWIGNYYFGDGLGVNCTLEIKSNATFAFRWQGCLGTYDKNVGWISFGDNSIVLYPEKSNIREGFQGTPTDFFLIPWDERHYLVPEEDIVEFCSDVNQGLEPRDDAWGSYYLKDNEWDKTVSGLPRVPQGFKSYLLPKSVEGRIIEILESGEAIIDIGSGDGLKPGMILTALDKGDVMFSQVEVVSVGDNQSKIKRRWKDSKLLVGQKVMSKLFDREQ